MPSSKSKKRTKSGIAATSQSISPDPMTVEEDVLVDDLLAELDSRDASTQREASAVLAEVTAAQADDRPKKDSRSRFQLRESRKAAAQAEAYASSTDPAADARRAEETETERRVISQVCADYHLELFEIAPDGHCLFSAVADQLALLSILPRDATHATTRFAAAAYIFAHPDDFLPFLPCAEGEDGVGATAAGVMTPAQFQAYCMSIRDTGKWGGEPEIQALARAYKVPIHVVQAAPPTFVLHPPMPGGTSDFGAPGVVRISYHRRMYGLGEHYNSLRPAEGKMHKAVDAVKAAFT